MEGYRVTDDKRTLVAQEVMAFDVAQIATVLYQRAI
jgi:hypothetical protein